MNTVQYIMLCWRPSSLGCLWGSLGLLWNVLGFPLAPFGTPMGSTSPSWSNCGTPCGRLACLWLPLTSFGVPFLDALGLFLSPFRMPLAPFVSLWGAFGSLWPSFGVASACLGIPWSNYWIFYEMSFSFASKCCSDPPSTRAGGQDYGSTQTPSKHS